jgi:hypothetical protein
MRWCGICVALTICVGCGHPWFKSGDKAPPDQRPELTMPVSPDAYTSSGEYVPGTPSWVPLIDVCMRRGGSRVDCIDALPPEELAALERWELKNGEKRRERMLRNRQHVPKLGVKDDKVTAEIEP